ncbi:MAG: hypothetical protein ACR2FO_09550 [Actinomycetota bacterium]
MAARNPAVRLPAKARRKPTPQARPAVRPQARYRPAGVATAIALFGLLASFIFGLVLLNIYVAQTSIAFDALQTQVADQQDEHRRLRYEMAVAESPGRLAEAVAQMGLVAPDYQERLAGPTEGTVSSPQTQELAAEDDLKPFLVRKQ